MPLFFVFAPGHGGGSLEADQSVQPGDSIIHIEGGIRKSSTMVGVPYDSFAVKACLWRAAPQAALPPPERKRILLKRPFAGEQSGKGVKVSRAV